MANTDNSKILQNFTERSLFQIHKPKKTSQKIGTLGVSNVELALPKDTIKYRKGTYFELKPTTNRIVTPITANESFFAVPLRSVWAWYDSFLSKGGDIVRNGAYNKPSMLQNESISVDQLPYVKAQQIFFSLLASIGGFHSEDKWLSALLYLSESIALTDENYEKLSGNIGSEFDYDFDFINHDGLYVKSFRDYCEANSITPYVGWWLPRLLGGGVKRSGVNLVPEMTLDENERGDLHFVLHFSDPNSVILGRWLYELMKANQLSTTFDLATNDVNSFNVHFSRGNILVSVSRYNYSVMNDGDNVNVDLTTTYNFSVNQRGLDDGFLASTTTDYSGLPSVPGDIVPILYNNSSGMYPLICSFLFTAVFNRSSLLGYGSLAESIGYHFFEELNVYDLQTEYSLGSNAIPVQLGYAWDSCVSVLSKGILDNWNTDDIENNANNVQLLPFFAYQKCAERFLLPHQILSNNENEDSTLDYSRYDSNYYRNNMIPSVFYGKPQFGTGQSPASEYGCAVLVMNQDTSELEYESGGRWASTWDASKWHYLISINQLWSVLFERGTLLEIDCFNKIWQKQDRNVTELMAQSEYGVNEDGTINAKEFLLAQKLGKFLLAGGTDQLANSVIENHFGVHDVPCDTNEAIRLSSRSYLLQTQEITNTGGGVDSQGNTMVVGDRVSIVQHEIPVHNVFECFVPDFAYIIGLHWFSVPFERTNVPNPSVRVLDSISSKSDVRKAFQIAFFPEYQASGDEMLYTTDIISFAKQDIVAWTNKLNTLKDGYREYCGEWKNRFYKQIITAYPFYRDSSVLPSLTYEYFQPTPFDYDLHLVDKFGDSMLVAHDNYIYKKSIMSKQNYVGSNGL